MAMLEKETGSPEEEEAKCGKKVRAFLDTGNVWLICTLAPHDGGHYDDAFCVPWKDVIEADTD